MRHSVDFGFPVTVMTQVISLPRSSFSLIAEPQFETHYFDDRALGPQNVVESELGSEPSHIGVRFTRWLTSLNARSTSMSRSISNRNRNVDTVRPCSAGSVRFSLSTRFGVLA